jgi:putative nucleotidyltransferase with HDIG domain
MSKIQFPPKLESFDELIIWSLDQLAKPFDSQSLIRSILEQIRELTSSVRADLLIYQSEMNVLFFSETSSVDDPGTKSGQISLADSKSSAAVRALINGKTVLIDDVHESGLLSLSPGARTIIGVPAIYGDRVHGVLNVEHNATHAFDNYAVKWIETIANILSILLETSYLAEQVFSLNQRLIQQMTESATISDPDFRDHAERVSIIAGKIAEKLGLPDEMIQIVKDSGILHDVGKTGVDKNILVKPGKLSEDELHEIQKHPVLGRFLLKPLGFKPAVIDAVASHHERWDGKGYPRGLTAQEIPIAGRILAVAEAYDVMTRAQPYRDELDWETALSELQHMAGTQFDPEVVNALGKMELEEL